VRRIQVTSALGALRPNPRQGVSDRASKRFRHRLAGLSIKKYFKTCVPWRPYKGPPHAKQVISLVELPTGDSIWTTLYLAHSAGS